jgi:hypothetical protein
MEMTMLRGNDVQHHRRNLVGAGDLPRHSRHHQLAQEGVDMRDIEGLNRTLRTIVEHGDGLITQRRNQYGHDWFAGRARLNNQMVTDLIQDGWIKITDKRGVIAGYTRGQPAPSIRELERKLP